MIAEFVRGVNILKLTRKIGQTDLTRSLKLEKVFSTNIESGSRQWPLLPILLPDIVFLGHRGINKLLLCKMHISFLSQRFRFCLGVS